MEEYSVTIGETTFEGAGDFASNSSAITAAHAECESIQRRADKIARMGRDLYAKWLAANPEATAVERVARRRLLAAPGKEATAAANEAWSAFHRSTLPGLGPDIPPDFGPRLQALREKAGLSRAALAAAVDLSAESIRLFETGGRRPTWDTVQALAAHFGVTTDTFRDKP